MITCAFTTWNRTSLLFEALANIVDHPFVSEVVISDDASDLKTFNEIEIYARSYGKIKLFRNEANQDCYLNKKLAVERSTNEWVALLDSDNRFSKDYINRIESLYVAGLNDKTVYQPEFAMPEFNFTHWSGLNITRSNVAQYMSNPTFSTMLNAANYFVNRAEYLRVFYYGVDPVTSDSIFQNYNWLRAGNSIYVVPGLSYEHRIHESSHYRNNHRRTPRGFHDSILAKLIAMR